jgi:hypothetical protein
MKVVWLVIIHMLALIGGFAIYGAIRQWRLSRRTGTKIERDIKKWEYIKKQYKNEKYA